MEINETSPLDEGLLVLIADALGKEVTSLHRKVVDQIAKVKIDERYQREIEMSAARR